MGFYVKLPSEINMFYLNHNNIYLVSKNYIQLNLVSNIIKSLKYPDPYKGKGIVFEYDVIKLKEGKKYNKIYMKINKTNEFLNKSSLNVSLLKLKILLNLLFDLYIINGKVYFIGFPDFTLSKFSSLFYKFNIINFKS